MPAREPSVAVTPNTEAKTPIAHAEPAGQSEEGARRDDIHDAIRRINADPLAAPIVVRTLCPTIQDARSLHFTYKMEASNKDVCRVQIVYNEHGTDMSRKWADETVVVDDSGLRMVPPQRTIRGVQYEFAIRATSTNTEGLPAPVVRVYMKTDSVKGEADHIRSFNPRRVAVLTDSRVLDLRVLRDIAEIYSLYGDISFIMKAAEVVSGEASPLVLVVDVAVSAVVDPVIEKVVDRYGKLHILRVQVHCNLCRKDYALQNPEVGQEITCPGCGAGSYIRQRQ